MNDQSKLSIDELELIQRLEPLVELIDDLPQRLAREAKKAFFNDVCNEKLITHNELDALITTTVEEAMARTFLESTGFVYRGIEVDELTGSTSIKITVPAFDMTDRSYTPKALLLPLDMKVKDVK